MIVNNYVHYKCRFIYSTENCKPAVCRKFTKKRDKKLQMELHDLERECSINQTSQSD